MLKNMFNDISPSIFIIMKIRFYKQLRYNFFYKFKNSICCETRDSREEIGDSSLSQFIETKSILKSKINRLILLV